MGKVILVLTKAGNRLGRPWGLFAWALIVRLVWNIFVVGLDAAPRADECRYHALATSLAAGMGYRVEGEAPTSFYPPLYPAVLSVVYKIAGPGPTAARLLQALLGACIVLLISHLGQLLFSRRVGLAAGLIASIYPMLIYFSSAISTENLFVVILLSLAFTLVKAQRSGSRLSAVVAGLLIGAAVLTRAFFLAFLPLILLWGLFPNERGLGLRRAALALLCALLAIAPWTYRNYLVHNAFVPVSTGGGAAFWGGITPMCSMTPIPGATGAGSRTERGPTGSGCSVSKRVRPWSFCWSPSMIAGPTCWASPFSESTMEIFRASHIESSGGSGGSRLDSPRGTGSSRRPMSSPTGSFSHSFSMACSPP